jgi:hypothetical protein
MPIHLENIDVVSEIAGVKSALIVPCNLCPAVNVAVAQKKPFIQFFRSFLKSVPFEQSIRELQTRLKESGIDTKVFKNPLPHHWFLCMWTSGRRKRLQKYAKHYEAVIVLGCDSATETVRDAVKSSDCKVVQAMVITGISNAKLRFSWPGNVSFDDGKTIPISQK